ncbi:DUF2486 family protein [Paraburkholderia sp. MPAMCS5]|uniref:DUF2486 family protein n=1 Tax=Paraburkholderia sp. MPAMCS5 TaxID=3112563 RepID=UPI002E1733D7|nr:DUF2486 family protein [Paraburkholderia sp. MPAMCS5]
MPDSNDNSIPTLQEILVRGHTAQRREPQSGAAAPAAVPTATPAAVPTQAPLREAEELDQAGLAAEPELAAQPVLTPEQTRAPEPVLAPQPAVHVAPAAHVALHDDPTIPVLSHRAAEAQHAHDEVLAASAGMFDRSEPPPPLEAGATVPPDIVRDHEEAQAAGVDAELIAGRLRERVAGFLTGDGRGIIEARCASAVQEHTARLVDQITREVVSTLENEMTGWVREAVEAEIARRTGGA